MQHNDDRWPRATRHSRGATQSHRARVVSCSLRATLTALSLVLALPPHPAKAALVRVKELAVIEGMRENQLIGYGLVVGLAGSGDSERVFFTSQSVSSMLARLGIRIKPEDVRTRNVAAVMVTGRQPTYARAGARLDVSVSSMGNARSLAGGVLLLTPLTGADGKTYAVAQGPVEAGGYDLRSAGSRRSRNPSTTGRVPGGATVERAVIPDFGDGPIHISLKQPDFSTAVRLADAINKELGQTLATPLDPSTVEIKLALAENPGGAGPKDEKTGDEAKPAAADDTKAAAGDTKPKNEAKKKTPPLDRVHLLARIETLEIDADQRARVVVNERTGTVVAGANVRIRAVAVAHGGLSISVQQNPVISQPLPFGQGKTIATRRAGLKAREEPGKVVALPATATVGELATALNLLGATPRDLVSILQAIKAAGALDADLEVI